MHKLLILSFLLGCGQFGIIKTKPAPQASKKELLQAQYKVNKAKLTGWPSRTDCDGVLWASEALLGGISLDIYEARDKEGKWYRSPSHDCFDTGRSRSDFSNDMLVGIVLACDGNAVRRYYAWLVRHNFIMGRGDRGATFVKPNVLGVLKRSLGKPAPRLPYIRNNKDYVRHIQMLMIYIDGRTTGYITEHELEVLESYDDGKDYLLTAIVARYNGDYERAIKLLLEEGHQPSYVRGDQPERYRLAHWLFAANIILEN